MAIDLTTPTIRPPSALDLSGTTPGRPDFDALSQLPAPTGQPAYQTPGDARQGQQLGAELGSFASDTLAQPSRFDLPMVQQGIDLVSSDLEESGRRASSQLDERMSQRGLVGSSVEAWNQKDMLMDLERERSRRLFDLNMAMANTQAGDRATAAGIGTQIGDFQRAMGLDTENAGRYEAEFGRLLGRDTEADLQSRAGLGMQGGQLGQGQYEFERMMGLEGGQFGLQQRALDLQAQGMSQDDAYRYAQLEQSGGQFGESMDFSRQQLAQELGISSEQMDLQREQMGREYGDRQADRLHQMGLQEGSQDFAASQAFLDRALERSALQLQRDGLSAEEAWREADRSLQEQLEGRSMDLQQQGMETDEALRRAAMDLDREMQQADISSSQAMEQGRQQTTQRGQNMDLMSLYSQMGMDAQLANQQASLSAADIQLRALAAGVEGANMPNYDPLQFNPGDIPELLPPWMQGYGQQQQPWTYGGTTSYQRPPPTGTYQPYTPPDPGDPTTGDPTTGDPTTGDPTTGDPTTTDPTTGNEWETTGDPTMESQALPQNSDERYQQQLASYFNPDGSPKWQDPTTMVDPTTGLPFLPGQDPYAGSGEADNTAPNRFADPQMYDEWQRMVNAWNSQ